MQSQLLKYAQLRIYKSMSASNLLNAMVCNRVMKKSILVDNSRAIYNLSSKIFGKTFTNAVVNATFCKVFTAGNSLKDADSMADYFRKQNIPIILDYCAQGEINIATGEGVLDANAALFAESAEALKDQANEMISIKITGLINMHTLKFLNETVSARDNFWKSTNVNGKLRGQQFFNALQKKYAGITQQQFESYVRKIYNFKGELSKFEIDEVEFKMKHHPFYMYEQQKNEDFVIKLFSPFSKDQWCQFNSMMHRIEKIVAPQAENTNGLRILVDAEQTYVQLAIEFIAEQMQAKYNKDKIYIIPTVQNYLKRSVERTKYEVEIAKRKGVKFAAKLVRGAYIVEETKIAKQKGVECPIVQCFDKTTENYMNSFQTIVDSFNSLEDGEVIVATHNINTVEATQKVYKESNSKLRVCYGQLLGLADHLTWKLKSEGFRVYKYLPWAETEVMIAYMIRRAEELNQMRYPLDTQYALLSHELKWRLVN